MISGTYAHFTLLSLVTSVLPTGCVTPLIVTISPWIGRADQTPQEAPNATRALPRVLRAISNRPLLPFCDYSLCSPHEHWASGGRLQASSHAGSRRVGLQSAPTTLRSRNRYRPVNMRAPGASYLREPAPSKPRSTSVTLEFSSDVASTYSLKLAHGSTFAVAFLIISKSFQSGSDPARSEPYLTRAG